jgi:hypothetical protein
MSKALRDDLRVDPRLERERGVRMPQVVEPDPW